MYEPEDIDMNAGRAIAPETSLTTPVNKNLESGTWTKSIIWGPNVPFKDFTQLEFNHEDDIVPEERSSEYHVSTWGCLLSYFCSRNCAASSAIAN